MRKREEEEDIKFNVKLLCLSSFSIFVRLGTAKHFSRNFSFYLFFPLTPLPLT